MRFQRWICPAFATQPRPSLPLVHARAPPPRSDTSPGARAAASALVLERRRPLTHSPRRSVHAGVQREASAGRHHVAASFDSPRISSPCRLISLPQHRRRPSPDNDFSALLPSTRRCHLLLNFPAEVVGLSSAPQDARTRRPRQPQVLPQLDLTRILTLDLQYSTLRHMLDFVGNRFIMSGLCCFSTLFLPLSLLHPLEHSSKMMFLLRYAYRPIKQQFHISLAQCVTRPQHSFIWQHFGTFLNFGSLISRVRISGVEFSYVQSTYIRTSIIRPQGNIRSYLWIGGKTKGVRFGLGNIRSCLWIGGKTKGAGFGLDAITLCEPWRRRLYYVTMIRVCPGQCKIERGRV